jgi:hypothetical protein
MADEQLLDSNGKLYEWQCPSHACAESKKIGWLNETIEEGQAWLRSQRGFSDYNKARDVIAGKDTSIRQPASYRSHINPNRLKRNIKEVVGTLAKLRPDCGYHSDNAAYSASAAMFNKVSRAWYLEAMADRSVRKALQHAAGSGRGWLRPIYRRDMAGTGRGDIILLDYSAECVLPVQLPPSNDFQAAYAMSYLDEMPVYMAHGMFPLFQDRLRPTASRLWYQSDMVRKSAGGNWLKRAFGRTDRADTQRAQSDLYVPIRYTYVIDLTINTTKSPIPMGEPGASWSYTVPFVGQDIPMGHDAKSGTPLFRKANETDARLYPYRRLLISTDTCNMYDGPSFDWHGMFPGISFCLDDWPWEPNGFSLIRDGFELNEAIKDITRGNMDKVMAQMNPGLGYDTNAVARKDADKYDPFRPNARVPYDGSATDKTPFQPPVDPQTLRVEQESFTQTQLLQDMMDNQMSIKDITALAKTRAVGSMDSLEKMEQASGPIVEDMSRTMEPPMRDLYGMLKYLIMQYYTTPRIMQWVGNDGVTISTFDYDPTSVVPSHIVGEVPDAKSAFTPAQRARIFADNLRFFILPGSLHEITQMVQKLGLIQLKKAGIKIDSQTVAEAWQIPNWGTLMGNTVLEKFESEQEMDLIAAAKMKELAGGEGLLPPGGVGAGKPSPEGRPPTNAQPPQIVSKNSGERSTISTSGK